MMYQAEDRIIRHVNTFTASKFEDKKSHQKNRKGITRVSKSNSKSMDKLVPYNPITVRLINNENHDNINQQKEQMISFQQHEQIQILLSRIKELENDLILVEKEKIELQKKDRIQKGRFKEELIESQYLTCKEDIQDLVLQKQKIRQISNQLQLENNLLKLNNGIQEQYIIKIQAQINQYRLQKSQQERQEKESRDICIQVDTRVTTQDKQVNTFSEQDNNIMLQANEVDYLQQLAVKFQNQTTEFNSIIQKLQEENVSLSKESLHKNEQILALQEKWRLLTQQNDDLKMINIKNNKDFLIKNQQFGQMVAEKNIQINTIKRQGQMHKNEKNKQLMVQNAVLNEKNKQLMVQNAVLNEKIKRVHQDQDKLNNRINTLSIDVSLQHHKADRYIEQKQMLEIELFKYQNKEKQYFLQAERMKKQVESHQNQLNYEYQHYKKELDQLLMYLEQKDRRVTQKQMLFSKIQEHKALNSHHNQQNNRYYAQSQRIIQHYQEKIKKIQGSLESYVTKLLESRRIDRQNQAQLILHQHKEQINANISEKVCLLTKIQILQREIQSSKKKGVQTYKRDQMAFKIEQKQEMMLVLRNKLIRQSQQYQKEVSLYNLLNIQNKKLNEQLRYVQSQNISLHETLKISDNKLFTLAEEINTIKTYYTKQIQEMEQNLSTLESKFSKQTDNHHHKVQLQSQIQQIGHEHACKMEQLKKDHQNRLFQVKKDYDILYNKYEKYKNLSVHLEQKVKKK